MDGNIGAARVRHTAPMTRGLALVALLFTLVPAGAAADQTASQRARLYIGAGAPLAVRGTHFVPGEQVTVTVSMRQKRMKRTVANGRGTFLVRFPMSLPRCSPGLIVLAVGNRGSRAMAKRPPMLCPDL
jgi:hypothetical protein